MPKRPKQVDNVTKRIYDKVFNKDINTNKEVEIRERFTELIVDEFRLKDENNTIGVQLKTIDYEKQHWQKNEHFTKIFHHEFRHAEEYYSLTKGEKHFVYDLAEFLKWEANILVDDEDIPLNQKQLAEKLGVSTKTVWENMKSLIAKRIVYSVEVYKFVYYFVNPYFVYKGQNININLPRLFTDLGYIDSSQLDSNGRSNRKKEQEKRITV